MPQVLRSAVSYGCSSVDAQRWWTIGLLYAEDTVQFLLSAVSRHISDCIASGVNRQKDLVAISSQRDACLTEDRCRLSECDQD